MVGHLANFPATVAIKRRGIARAKFAKHAKATQAEAPRKLDLLNNLVPDLPNSTCSILERALELVD